MKRPYIIINAAMSADGKLDTIKRIWTSFHVIQAFIPAMVKNGWGRIVMITSPYASRPAAEGGPYAIGKAGQEALMLTHS